MYEMNENILFDIFSFGGVHLTTPCKPQHDPQAPGTIVVWRPGRETLKIAQDGPHLPEAPNSRSETPANSLGILWQKNVISLMFQPFLGDPLGRPQNAHNPISFSTPTKTAVSHDV